MSTGFHYHPRRIDVDLGDDLSIQLYNEIISWHGQIAHPPAASTLSCLDNGEPMYLVHNHHGRFFARHYDGGNPERHRHIIASKMSDEHRRQCEYVHRSATSQGLKAEYEKSTGNNTRLDVAVFGNQNTGLEIQRSGLSRAKAKRRAKLSFDAGWPTAWISDQQRDPDWADHVPTARLTVRGWESIPPPNTVPVIIGDYTRERDRERRTGWRYVRTPKELLLDELAFLMPAGAIVPVSIGTEGRVDLAYAGARDVIDSCTYPDASLWQPTFDTPRHKEAPQRMRRKCRNRHAVIDQCCWDATEENCSCWDCLTRALVETYEDEIKAWVSRTRCPGCERMHLVNPCFPNCNDYQVGG
jgi:hypothetical protein